jgi:putative hydrolase of HD superfamily
MARSLFESIEMLMSMQRWNFLPRVETWSEAENAAYVAHLAYAIAREKGEDDEFIKHLLLRVLLQSLRKYRISDIPKHTVDMLKEFKVEENNAKDENYYESLVNKAAEESVELFPRPIGEKLIIYLKEKNEYAHKDLAERIEALFQFCKRMAALQECQTNKKVYDWSEYDARRNEIDKSKKQVKFSKEYEEIYNNHEEYFFTVRNLKYLRRWNRINRTIETSVLAHTYVVAVLASIYSLYEEMMFVETYERKHQVEGNLQFLSILLALFHDILESLTGDVITPVKEQINKLSNSEGEKLWDKVEKKQRGIILNKMPPKVKNDVNTYGLLKELNMNDSFTVSSFTKQCDMLALIIECVFELKNNPSITEMRNTYEKYLERLKNSEWFTIKQLAQEIALEYPSFGTTGAR